ncbi:hypothetical protein ILYODFUR_034652 [Ilyodon furcidens]|uniref:Secreted protein n=1 Tax=Ilyodon furcidens TaxID=33524 RepID=A0ABV0V8K3_9TELE
MKRFTERLILVAAAIHTDCRFSSVSSSTNIRMKSCQLSHIWCESPALPLFFTYFTPNKEIGCLTQEYCFP